MAEEDARAANLPEIHTSFRTFWTHVAPFLDHFGAKSRPGPPSRPLRGHVTPQRAPMNPQSAPRTPQEEPFGAKSGPRGEPRVPNGPPKDPQMEPNCAKNLPKTTSKNSSTKTSKNTSKRLPKRAKKVAFWTRLTITNDLETQKADFHQTLACVCQNTILKGGRGPEYLQKPSSEHLFSHARKTSKKHTPKLPNGVQKGAKSEPKSKKKVLRKPTEKTPNKNTPQKHKNIICGPRPVTKVARRSREGRSAVARRSNMLRARCPGN
jgi:hypothetical protein